MRDHLFCLQAIIILVCYIYICLPLRFESAGMLFPFLGQALTRFTKRKCLREKKFLDFGNAEFPGC